MKATYIYALCDPETKEVRYIGKSDTPQRRFRHHLRDKKRNYRTNWIRKLQAKNLCPILEILAEVPSLEWQRWERSFIKFFRLVGANLVNATDGGEGVSIFGERHHNFGKPLPDWHKQALREARLGKSLPEETKTKLRNVLRVCNTSGTPGVCYNKKSKKWRAQLARNGLPPYIGQFLTLEEAVAARKQAETHRDRHQLTKVPNFHTI